MHLLKQILATHQSWYQESFRAKYRKIQAKCWLNLPHALSLEITGEIVYSTFGVNNTH